MADCHSSLGVLSPHKLPLEYLDEMAAGSATRLPSYSAHLAWGAKQGMEEMVSRRR